MRKYCVLFLVPLLFLVACNSATSEKKTAGNAGSAPVIPITKKVSDIEPALNKADRAQIIYYDNPDGDSLRYTRFFTYTETNDTTQVKTLLNEINQQVYVQEPKTRPCRSEGKLHLLNGEDILKTIYFSTRGDGCTYFYFIKDGAFIYFPLTGTAEKVVKENKQKARKPKMSS